MKKQLLLLVLMMLPMVASAHDIEVQNADGKTIYYNFINDGTELEVTYRGPSYDSYSDEYIGNVVIPEEVTYMNITRKVTSIGVAAFSVGNGGGTRISNKTSQDFSGLSSVTIPNSVTSIGDNAFASCSGLTSVTIGNSVTNIGSSAFYSCTGLEKVIVSDIASWCGITFADSDANPLIYAKHLYSDENTEIKDIVIPNSVTRIRNKAFAGCYALTSVTIGDGVTSIGSEAFKNCFGLTSITIGNSVTSIDNNAFWGCSGLTSITIPNSVTKILYGAFEYCTGLTSVTIGSGVTSIGRHAFDGANILTVISLIENPFKIDGKISLDYTFSLYTFNNATLYVPVGTIDKYKATIGWMDFTNIVEGVPSGINVVEMTRNNKTAIYDLNGVRQPEPKRGVNIIDGRKVVVK